jgi:hypothetical protein
MKMSAAFIGLAALIVFTVGCGKIGPKIDCPAGTEPTTRITRVVDEIWVINACFTPQGKISGPSITATLSGRRIFSLQFQNSVLEGQQKLYDEDGRGYNEDEYKSGKPTGWGKRFRADGSLKTEAYFDDSTPKSGKVWNYDEQGDLKTISVFTHMQTDHVYKCPQECTDLMKH